MTGDPADLPPGYRATAPRSAFAGLVGPFLKHEDGSRCRRAIRLEPRHGNRRGVGHGGLMTAFADILLSEAVALAGAGPAVTVRLVTDFVAPASLGELLEGEADVTRAGRSLVFAEGRLFIGRRTVMRASGVFARMAMRRNAVPQGEE